MAKYSSPSVNVYVDGYDLTPALVESMSHSVEAITQQTNPFGSATEKHTPVGVTKGTVGAGGGIFDAAVDPLHAGKIPYGGVGVSRIVCLCNEGQARDKHFAGFEGAYSQKSEAVDVNAALTKANVTYLVSGKCDENAVVLQENAAKTADWDTHLTPYDAADDTTAEQHPITSASVAASSVITCPDSHGLTSGDVIAIFGMAGGITPDINDSGAGAWQYVGHTVTVISGTTFSIPVDVSDDGTGGYFVVVSRATGGHGYQQVLQGSGFTNFVGKIKHSVDGAVWADLITFADTTTNYHNAQRLATATATVQVRRYLSFYGDVTGAVGATPFKVFAGFARGM
jgi:hypothetical protein